MEYIDYYGRRRPPTEEELREEYWVEYYKRSGIDYVYTKNLRYQYFIYELSLPDNGVIDNKAVEHLLSEFKYLTKNTASYSKAMDYWIGNCRKREIRCTREDVSEAYTLAYGHGCEYEFEYL